MADAWATTVARLAPDGLLVDGTCDELGRLATWVAVTADGPVSLSLSWRLRGLERPGVVAERLPKALIHRNVPGEGVHGFSPTSTRRGRGRRRRRPTASGSGSSRRRRRCGMPGGRCSTARRAGGWAS